MDILSIFAIGALNIACFFIGAKVGQMSAKGETIKMPSVNPVDAWEHRKERKEAEREKDRVATILRNIENYDGTEIGQEDVPRG